MSKKTKQADSDKNFEAAFAATVRLEGGYVNDPEDPGGETFMGISKRAYPDLDISALTEDDVKAIYLKDYWDPLRLSEVENPDIAGEIFDTAVNMGCRSAVEIAQKALNYLGEDLVEDGIIGSRTIAAINKWSEREPRALFVCMNGFQFIRYTAIVTSKPQLSVFARGWTRRIQQYKEV